MILSAERLAVWETCPRRSVWTARYGMPRVSLIGALYRAVDAGLRTEKDPERAAENELLSIAASPGLDITGPNVYSAAMHTAKIAGIVSVALRSASTAPWKPVGDAVVPGGHPEAHAWRSACYDAGDGHPRRVVLVDRWSDDRKAQEIRSWRTIGEACALKSPIMLTAVTIGSPKDGRRISPWTRCYQHPRNRTYRFKRKTSQEDFGATWKPIWREDSGFPTAEWLTRMQKDGCMADAVQTCSVPVPPRRGDYVREIQRIALDIERWQERVGETPPMRLAGCYGFSPCIFIPVCHGASAPVPENYHFKVLQGKASLPDVPSGDTQSIPTDAVAHRSPASRTRAFP